MSVPKSRDSGRRTPPRVVGVCDLGTFSALILISQLRRGRLTALVEERHTIDLTRDCSLSGSLSRAAVGRAARALRRFEVLTREFQCDTTAAVATAALRTAPNRGDFLRQLDSTGCHPVQVLTASAEARLAALGARSGFPRSFGSLPVVDIGGGSIELVGHTGRLFRGIRVGAVTATVAWAADRPHDRTKRAAYFRAAARQRLRRLGRPSSLDTGQIIGVGGTIATLAAMSEGRSVFDPARLHGTTLTADWIRDTAATLAARSQVEIAAMLPFDRTRARILTAGTFLWAEVINRLSTRRVIVSVRGLRWGAAIALASDEFTDPAIREGTEIT